MEISCSWLFFHASTRPPLPGSTRPDCRLPGSTRPDCQAPPGQTADCQAPPGQTARLMHGVFKLSVHPSIRLSVTNLVNTVFWKRMNGFWYQLAQVVHGQEVKGHTRSKPGGGIILERPRVEVVFWFLFVTVITWKHWVIYSKLWNISF